MDIQEQADRVLRESYRVKNRAECRVIEIGRTAHNPRRRMAPLNDSYDAVTNWMTVGFLLACSAFTGIGFAKTVMQIARWVR